MPRGYDLYGAFGDRYDLHTPPHHYAHDHEFVIERARKHGTACRLLDIGCGTGVLLEKARAVGLDALGLDSAPVMLALAAARVGADRVQCIPMQQLDFELEFDCIVSLSWSLNYCHDLEELRDVLRRCWRALRPGGELILQVAHAAHAPKTPPEFNIDREVGPAGLGDTVLRYRFWGDGSNNAMRAEYRFECVSTGERFDEVHDLGVADASLVERALCDESFERIELLESWEGQPFRRSISPIIIAHRDR